jgi:hypothetical protein
MDELKITDIPVLDIQYFTELFIFTVATSIFYIQVDVVCMLHINFMMEQLVIHPVIKIVVGKTQFLVVDLRLIYDDCPEIQVGSKKIIDQFGIEDVI